MATGHKSMAKTIAKGAVGVAAAAGVVAGAAVLADKDMRKNMFEAGKKTLEAARDRYSTTNHKLSVGKTTTKKSKRTMSKKDMGKARTF